MFSTSILALEYISLLNRYATEKAQNFFFERTTGEKRYFNAYKAGERLKIPEYKRAGLFFGEWFKRGGISLTPAGKGLISPVPECKGTIVILL